MTQDIVITPKITDISANPWFSYAMLPTKRQLLYYCSTLNFSIELWFNEVNRMGGKREREREKYHEMQMIRQLKITAQQQQPKSRQ